jgi:arginine N-succinyltransferase
VVLALCNTSSVNFRATFSDDVKLCTEQNVLLVSNEVADALKVQNGDFVRYLNLEKGAK